MKRKLLTVSLTFIVAITLLALLNKLEVVKITIDSMTALVIALTGFVAPFVHSYLEKK